MSLRGAWSLSASLMGAAAASRQSAGAAVVWQAGGLGVLAVGGVQSCGCSELVPGACWAPLGSGIL